MTLKGLVKTASKFPKYYLELILGWHETLKKERIAGYYQLIFAIFSLITLPKFLLQIHYLMK